jgi:3-hydroxyisobutyrate dehydrogenase
MALVGFVGLGKMGWPMARNLAGAGVALVVHDADAGRADEFAAEHGAHAAQDPGDFAPADAVVAMLPDDRAVAEAMLEWRGGIAPALAPAAVIVDMSSSDPIATRALGERLAVIGPRLVDAPVSGGITGARDGTLSIMVGADDADALARVRPLLEILGARLFLAGRLGCGHAMKALNNFLAGAAHEALAEALRIGEHFGLAPETMLGVVNSSTGRSFSSEVVFPEEVVTGRYATGFALGLLAKDTAIAASLARSAGIDAPACRLVGERWAQAADGLGTTADHSQAHMHWYPPAPADAGPASGRM